MSIVLMLDLSQPNELWFTLETLLKQLKAHIEATITAARRDDPNIKTKLKEKTQERIGTDNPVSNYQYRYIIVKLKRKQKLNIVNITSVG